MSPIVQEWLAGAPDITEPWFASFVILVNVPCPFVLTLIFVIRRKVDRFSITRTEIVPPGAAEAALRLVQDEQPHARDAHYARQGSEDSCFGPVCPSHMTLFSF